MHLHKRRIFLFSLLLSIGAAQAEGEDYGLRVDVRQDGAAFVTDASFKLPLRLCQAWLYLTDYEAATGIPGIVTSRSTRLGANAARVERTMKDRILLFPIEMRSVIEFRELPGKGTDFVQIEGKAKSHQGSWRLEEEADGTLYRYHAVSVPDSVWPMAVVRYFVNNRLEESFAAMAEQGAKRKDRDCP